MLTLYQAEWCPYSRKVRLRLTELGVDFVAKQVEPDPPERHAMKEAVGTNSIPVLVTDDGEILDGIEKILPWLNERYEEPESAARHRRKFEHEKHVEV